MYQKEIVYIGLYKDNNRLGSAGFLKVENKEQICRFCLKAQNIPLGISGRFPVRIYDGSGWQEFGGVTIQDGRGNWEDSLKENVDRTMVQVMLPGGYILKGRSRSLPESFPYDLSGSPKIQEQTVPEPMTSVSQAIKSAPEPTASMPQAVKPAPEPTVSVPQAVKPAPEPTAFMPQAVKPAPEPMMSAPQAVDKSPEPVVITEELLRPAPENIDAAPRKSPNCNLKEDKWEQILETYEQIHPYGDGRVYVKLEPKDFVILQAKYQHLVNNSFLLHGFYNYRYVILGKDQDYYLGVPGVYYDREKMVALMFGFEAFECPGGNVRPGEFGYYLRRVEL